jgi:pimeloyl-ACP methyl ester carboxylesterase
MTAVTPSYQRIDPIRGSTVKTAQTSVLDIAYQERGPAGGPPVVLMHGFPDDIHAYDGVAPPLAAAGYRVIVPYLRGYGPTRFLEPAKPRSGQQAALGHDLLDLINALDLTSPILAGYDWGGRAACIVAALWPERVGGLVSIGGYNIQNIANSGRPQAPVAEYRHWYQWYFHPENRAAPGIRQRFPDGRIRKDRARECRLCSKHAPRRIERRRSLITDNIVPEE